ncbi:MAG: hypothetical protein ABGY75_05570, partial [Gemmataceae bacterium]
SPVLKMQAPTSWEELNEPGRKRAGGTEEVVSGRFVWLRGQAAENGDEYWKVANTWERGTSATEGGTLANAFGAAGGKTKQSESKGEGAAFGRTISLGKMPGTAWTRGTGRKGNPIAEDRPVCLKEYKGGWGDDQEKPDYTIRVMAQVVTPALVEQRKEEATR